MSQPNVKDVLAAAELALAEGDLADADALLRNVASIEEATLGPLHPDLAATMSNLAIVAEKAGRQPDAERYYRRAADIASASLPADDPMVAATRENLQDFCRLHGLPVDVEPAAPPAIERPAPPAVPSAPRAIEQPAPPKTDRAIDPVTPASKADRRVDRPARYVPAEAATPATISATVPPPATESTSRKWIVIAVVILAAVAFLVMRWSSRDESTSVPPEESAARPANPRPTAPAEPPARAPSNEAPAPPVVPPRNDRGVAASKPAAKTPSSGPVTVIYAELCRTFSASGQNWQCAPAGDVVAPGRVVLYTKVKSQRDATVMHRWYRGNSLVQSVRLRISPNGTAGYRTYSRQTAGPGEWHVEVRSAEGDLLQEKRFVVR